MQIKLHPLAQEDYKKAIDYYYAINAELEQKFITHLDNCFHKIVQFPNLYPFEIRTAQKVIMQRFPYVILYEKYQNEIMILAIFHTKQNPRKLQGRIE